MSCRPRPRCRRGAGAGRGASAAPHRSRPAASLLRSPPAPSRATKSGPGGVGDGDLSIIIILIYSGGLWFLQPGGSEPAFAPRLLPRCSGAGCGRPRQLGVRARGPAALRAGWGGGAVPERQRLLGRQKGEDHFLQPSEGRAARCPPGCAGRPWSPLKAAVPSVRRGHSARGKPLKCRDISRCPLAP